MTVVTVLSARSLWFVPLGELNPMGRNLHRCFNPRLENSTVSLRREKEKDGVIFSGGEFASSANGGLMGVELTLFVGGLMAKTLN
jgi:hypothetical protein